MTTSCTHTTPQSDTQTRTLAASEEEKNAAFDCFTTPLLKELVFEETSKNQLNFFNAYRFALMSASAYSNEEEAKRRFEKLGFKNPQFLEFVHPLKSGNNWLASDSQAYWLEDNENIYLIFRGTEARNNNNDALTNTTFIMQQFGTLGNVHVGFYGALTYFWPHISKKINSIPAGKTKNMHIMGHSLGAALATLTAAKILQRQTNNDALEKIELNDDPNLKTKSISQKIILRGLTTFGSPKVGDDQFSTVFNYLVYKSRNDPIVKSQNENDFEALPPRGFYSARFVNGNDLIPTIPLNIMGYKHIDDLFYFSTNEGLLIGDKALNSVPSAWTSDVERWIRDHSMLQYIKKIGMIVNIPINNCVK